MHKKTELQFGDLDDVTLGSSAIFFETEMEFESLPTGAFKDPWLSVPTSQWVWL